MRGSGSRLEIADDDAGEPNRFLAEPVDCLWVDGAVPLPSRPIQRLFRNHTERAIVDGGRNKGQMLAAFHAAWRDAGDKERYLAQFEEQLIAPVQPLRDHLASTTYVQFERALPKYEHYRRAVLEAMKVKPPRAVAVAGAGRGPLVEACLHAIRDLDLSTVVYAVEKNPNAVVTLHHRNRREWGGRAQVIEADMRSWAPPEPVGLLVSELLGSFADNELSPECLAGAERWLAPDGISIPRRTTSFVAPVFAPRLSSALGDRKPECERPVGITLHRVQLLADPEPCFVFDHPNPIPDHRRFRELSFTAGFDASITGFAGFFEADLFGDIGISTRPSTATPELNGWSTLYFPLSRPVDVKAGGFDPLRLLPGERRPPRLVRVAARVTAPPAAPQPRRAQRGHVALSSTFSSARFARARRSCTTASSGQVPVSSRDARWTKPRSNAARSRLVASV